jgi:hypothetical protein
VRLGVHQGQDPAPRHTYVPWHKKGLPLVYHWIASLWLAGESVTQWRQRGGASTSTLLLPTRKHLHPNVPREDAQQTSTFTAVL